MMRDNILNFNKQFEYEPEIVNPEKLKHSKKFVIAGMGGSNLVADLLLIRDPGILITIHRDYGLPAMSESELHDWLIIANSYSGNTEETIDALETALKNKFSIVVIAIGGKLIDMAKEYELAYIQMPTTGIQPRSALGFNMRATLKIMGREDLLEETKHLVQSLIPSSLENNGRKLAEKLKGHVPVIYSSNKNMGIAYNWKIKFNETGKIPSFYNVISELNHNEMTGFDPVRSHERVPRPTSNGTSPLEERKKLNDPFHFLFLKDPEDHPRILKRMDVMEKLYRDRGLPVDIIEISGNSMFEKIFSSLILADWTAYYTAEQYGLESEHVPMIEEFKKLIT